MLEGQFSTFAPSAPAAELTAAAAVGLLLEEENSSARLRRVSWIADSTYARTWQRKDAGSAPTLSWPTTLVAHGQRHDDCRVSRPATSTAIQASRATSARTCWQNWAVEAEMESVLDG